MIELDDLLHGEEPLVAARVVLEALRHRHAFLAELVRREVIAAIGEGNRWTNDVMILEPQRQVRVIRRAHDLVNLLSWTDAGNPLRKVRGHRTRQVHDAN